MHVLQLLFPPLHFALLLLVFVFQFPFLVEQFILPLNQNFLFLGLGFLARLLDDAACQIIGVTYALRAQVALNKTACKQTGKKNAGNAQAEKKYADGHNSSSRYVDGRMSDCLPRRPPDRGERPRDGTTAWSGNKGRVRKPRKRSA